MTIDEYRRYINNLDIYSLLEEYKDVMRENIEDGSSYQKLWCIEDEIKTRTNK